jgi:hypothetical protein
MNKVNRQTKAQYKALLQCHNGAGVLHYKSADNCVSSIEFYINRKGQICFPTNGKPVYLQVQDLLDDDSGISTIDLKSEIVNA